MDRPVWHSEPPAPRDSRPARARLRRAPGLRSRTLGGADRWAAAKGYSGLCARPTLGAPPAYRPTGNRASSTAGSQPRPTSGSRAAPRAGAVTRNGPPPQDEVLPAAGNCLSPAPPRPKKVLGLPAPQGQACGSRRTHQSSSGTHRGLPSRPRRPGDCAPPAAAPPAPFLLAARVRASHLPSSD